MNTPTTSRSKAWPALSSYAAISEALYCLLKRNRLSSTTISFLQKQVCSLSRHHAGQPTCAAPPCIHEASGAAGSPPAAYSERANFALSSISESLTNLPGHLLHACSVGTTLAAPRWPCEPRTSTNAVRLAAVIIGRFSAGHGGREREQLHMNADVAYSSPHVIDYATGCPARAW